MADLDYSVGVAGLKDLKELEARIKSLDTLLKKPIDASGLDSIAAALRKVQRASGASGNVAAEVRKLHGVAEELKSTFKGTGDAIADVLRSELSKTAASIRMDVVALGERAVAGMGDATGKQLKEETRKIKGAAALAKAELDTAYNNLVGENGGREYIRDPGKLAIVRALKEQGATISGVHAQQLRLLDEQAKELAAAAKRSAKTQADAILEQANTVAAAENRATALMDQARAGRLKALTETGGPIKASETTFANMLRQEETAANSSRAAWDAYRATKIAALSAAGTAGKASDTVFAQMLREEEVAAKADSAALQTLRVARTEAITNKGQGSVKAGGTLLAQMLREEEAAARAAAAALETRARAMNKAATLGATANYSVLSTGKLVDPNVANINAAAAATRAANKAMAEGKKASKELTDGYKALSVSSADLHATSRGLASGFGALWLTWGNLLPLMAGAAISNGFMKTAKEGMEVANTFSIIQHLGENTAQQVQTLRDRMVELGVSGIHGPQELASAMQTLSLAGLKATEILGVTASVMNFSMAGTTSIENAADVLVSVTTAFGTGAAGFERSSDIIMRAAADSKASVESFGEAMKTASVVGEQYGARQEDVALQIQYLANLGIQGTAAGTAVRNMYADITGRSGQVTKILKSFGMDFKDAEGNVLGLEAMVKQLYDTLSQYDAKSQGNIIQAIFGERGAKSAVALMQAYKTAASEGSGFANKLAEDLHKIETSAGDAAIAAAHMGESTKNAFKQAGATFETTLYKAFEVMEPQLYLTAKAMKAAFGSSELQSTLNSTVSAIATMTRYLAENAQTIAAAVVAYASYRGAIALVSSGIGAMISVSQGYAAAKALMTGRTVASTAALAAETTAVAANAAATTASNAANAGRLAGALGFIKVLPVVGNMVAAAGLAWSIYDMFFNKANNTGDTYVKTKADAIAEKLNNEAAHLEEVNKLRAAGITLQEAEARAAAANAKQKIDTAAAEATALASARSTRMMGVIADINDKEAAGTMNAGDERRRQRAQDRLAEDMATLNKYEKERVEGNNKIAEAEKRAAEARRASYALAMEEGKKLADQTKANFPSGQKSWDLASFQGAGRGGRKGSQEFERADLERNNELKSLEAFYTARAGVIESAYSKESRFLDMRREGEIISESEYIATSFQMATKYENDRIAMATEKSEEYLKLYAARQQRMREAMDASKDPVVKDMYKQQLEKEQNEAKAFTEKTVAEIEKIKIDSNARVEQSFIKLESTAYKLMKTDKDFWEKRKRDTARKQEADDLDKAYENINESVFSTEQAQYAQAKATLEVKHATEEHIQELTKQVEIQEEILKALQEELRVRMQLSGQDPVQLQSLMDGVNRSTETLNKLRARLSKAVDEGVTEGAEAGAKAFDDQMDKQAKGFRNALTDSAVTALLDGGKEGGKKLRDYLQEELLRKPLTVMLNGVLESIMGSAGGSLLGMLGGLFGLGSGGGGGGGGSGLLGAVNAGHTAYSAYGVGQAAYGGYLGNYFLSGPIASGANALGLGNLTTAAGNYLNWGTTKPTLDMILGINSGSTAAGSGAAAGGSSSSTAGFAAGGWVMAVPLIAAYLGGMFKDEKQVGQGVTGRLGGDLYGYQLMRESGSMFSGPDYRYVIAEKEIKKADEEIARLKKEIEDNPGDRANGYRQYQLQNLYSRRERLHELYDPSIESTSGPIKALNEAFKAMRESTASQADILGLDGKRIREMTVELGLDEIHPDTGGRGLQLTGLTAEEAQKKIEEALAQANEQMAREVLGTWKERTREVTRMEWDVVDNGTEGTGGDTNTQSRVGREVTETITEQVWEMSEFVREGETAVQALARLSSSLTLANGWFETINGTLYETSLAGADMASQLIDAFGGADKFAEATNTYFQAYYSEAERTAAMTSQLTKQFKAAGVEMPTTREAFRALAESQDLTTESGRKTYAALLQLAGAANELYTAAEQAKEALKSMLQTLSDELFEAQGRYKELVTAQHNRKLEELRKTGGQEAVDMQLWIWYYEAQNYLRKQEIEILKAQGKEMEAVTLEREMELKQIEVYGDEAVANAKKLWALQDEAKARAEQEAAIEKRRKQLFDQLTASINREKEALEKTRTASQEVIDNLRAVVDAAKAAAIELYNTIDSTSTKQVEEARESIKAILATLKSGGKAPTAAVLSGAISQARTGLSSENFLTEYEYQRQTLVLAGHLAQIGELTEGGLTVEEQILEGINKQIEQYDSTLEYYEKQLGLGQEGIDATMSVGQAVADIEAFLRNARTEDKAAAANPGAGTGTGTGTEKPVTDPWGGSIYTPGTGGPKLGGIDPNGSRNYVVGYTKDGRAIYKDGTTEQYKPGEYVYDGNQLSGTGSLTSEQWARLQAGQEPFPGYWSNGQYNSNGKYTWSNEKNMYVPSFDTGINVLPHDTLAMLHKGESVVPAKYNEFNPNASSVKDDEMMKVLQMILKEIGTQTGIQALSTELQQKIHDMLDTVTEGGNAMRSVNMETIEVKIVEMLNGVM